MEVRVHAGFEHRDAAELAELRGVSLVVEGAGDHDVESAVARLARRGHQVRPAHGAELRANQDARALLLVPLHILALGADQVTGPRSYRGEGDAVLLVRLL